MTNGKINYTIEKSIAVLSSAYNGDITKELNVIAFNGYPAKYDIRSWKTSKDGNRFMQKGITLTEAEAKELRLALDALPELN